MTAGNGRDGTRSYACFATPILDPSLARIDDATGLKSYVAPGTAPEATGDPEMDYMLGLDPSLAALDLTDREIEALSRFLPSLLCGEESAVVIFAHEGRRLDRAQQARIAASMRQLSLEEERHEIILTGLSDWMPKPDDQDEILARAQNFFIGLGFASASPEERLAHISALDGCVSIALGAACKQSTLRRSETFLRIVDRIRRDEARHVRICRRHLEELGVDGPAREAAGATVRSRFIELMSPIADSFEAMGMDADKLFGRIRNGSVI